MAEYIDPMKPLIEEFMTEWRIQHDDNVMKAVADVGIVVDKPRLMQALTDAKAFYEEGYRAAMNRADVVEVVRCKDCKYQDDCARQMVHTTRDYVLEQNISTYNKIDFCSFGAKMDGKGEGE